MIYIRECLNGEGFYTSWKGSGNTTTNLTESYNDADQIDPKSIMVDIEGIHEYPVATRNFTRYHESALKGSIPTWTKPYLRPMILHHNEKDGRIIGRVRAVEYKKTNTASKTPALLFSVNVPDKEGKEGIQDGRLKTVSIGVIVNDCRCSICGQNIAEEGECDHERGVEYNGEICYWDIYSMEAKELSYVIVPSDIYAQNIKIYKPGQESNKEDFKESFKKGAMNMEEQDKNKSTSVTEDTVIDETVKDDKTVPELTEDQKEVARLKEKVKNLEADLATEKDKAEKAISKLNDATKSVETLQKDLGAAKDSLILKDADLIKEKHLRESIEEELLGKNKEIRESLEDKFVSLREGLGKVVVAKEELSKRSDESLKDSIKDLKEEFSKKNAVNVIEKTTNPSIVDNDDEKPKPKAKVDVTESLEDKSKLQEQLETLLYSIMTKK